MRLLFIGTVSLLDGLVQSLYDAVILTVDIRGSFRSSRQGKGTSCHVTALQLAVSHNDVFPQTGLPAASCAKQTHGVKLKVFVRKQRIVIVVATSSIHHYGYCC